ncbi:MAG: sigma-70 family RNA polymerase sigma factor [Planctomycetota bacterium]
MPHKIASATAASTPCEPTLAKSIGTFANEPRPMDELTRAKPDKELVSAADSVVVAAVLGGNRDAFQLLVERYQNQMYRLALRLENGNRDRAADLAQESFLRAFRGLAGFAFDAKFGTWLHRVTVNTSISQKRREKAKKRGTALSLDETEPDGGEPSRQVASGARTPAQETIGGESTKKIYEAIYSLDDELKTLVILVNLEGESYETAAEILNIPVGTVRSRLHRAREVLAQKLQKLIN